MAIVSDAAWVNKGLGVEISQKLGLMMPGPLYSCIHSVLGFQVGAKDLWMKYEAAIGNRKCIHR